MSGMLRQPSQPSSFVEPDGNDLRVHDDRGLALRTGIFVQQRHKQAEPFVHLRRRQSHTVILVHRVDHVVDQLLHQRIVQIRLRHRSRPLPQNGMAHARDLENRHKN